MVKFKKGTEVVVINQSGVIKEARIFVSRRRIEACGKKIIRATDTTGEFVHHEYHVEKLNKSPYSTWMFEVGTIDIEAKAAEISEMCKQKALEDIKPFVASGVYTEEEVEQIRNQISVITYRD